MSATIERAWSAGVAARLAAVMPEAEAAAYLPLIEQIRRLKAGQDAVVVAHNYQVPAITAGIADFVGDSLAMAHFAAAAPAATIVVCGVRFMAETTKLLAPDRRVLLPAMEAGCSLAEAITAQDVRALRDQHPGVPVVAYVNTSAAVKAESDICCTSANAVQVVRSLRAPRVIMIPDRHLASYVAEQVDCQIIAWPGACEVHERFSGSDIRAYADSDVHVLAHPECPAEVRQAARFVGSTGAMNEYLRRLRPRRVLLLTECSMADNVTVENPQIEFLRPCNLCRHMKAVTLQRVRDVLLQPGEGIGIEPALAERARLPLQRMLAV